jgi:hypothetical protein
MEHTETFAKFHRILDVQGPHQALLFLNSRTSHRFTGVYRFEPPIRRSVHLVDAYDSEVRRGHDTPIAETYCSIVAKTEQPFFTQDAAWDHELFDHPARDSVSSYWGVLIRNEERMPIGTLCHFDVKPCAVAFDEVALMEAAGPVLFRYLESL